MKNTTIGFAALSAVSISFAGHAGEIDQGLLEVLGGAKDGQVISSLVFMLDQPDVQLLVEELAAQRASFARRNKEVVRLLQDSATLAQRDLLLTLKNWKAEERVERFDSFWIANVVRVDAPADVLHEIAARRDVLRVYYNAPITTITPVDDQLENPRGENDDQQGGVAGSGPATGVVAVRAPEAWGAGYTGAGIVVATLDTGVDGSHPAVASRWRGHDSLYAGNPQWAWFDPVTNTSSPQEFHWSSHGTHTMGTVVGGLPGEEVGVAPGAQWVHAAVIDRVNIQTTIADAIASFQWLAAPTGVAGDAWAVPRVASNSWGLTASHGQPACSQTFWSWIDNGEAAGTIHFFAAGNEGNNGLRRPADRATDEFRSSAVAAVDANNPDWPAASFSSRGPTSCTPDGTQAIKPDIAAPGVAVRSAVSGGSYGNKGGTSMAAPHVNGVAALMLEACDSLTPEEVKQIIYDTAFELGPEGKDNTFGWGMIDAFEAVNAAIAQCTIGLKVPYGTPAMLDPGMPTSFIVEVVEGTELLVPGSAMLLYRFDDGEFQSVPLVPLNDSFYEAVLPAPTCGQVAEFYVRVEGDLGSVRSMPSLAPQVTFNALVGEFVTVQTYYQDFADGLPEGWTANGLWHVSQACSVGGECGQGSQYAYYGQSGTCNFATGSANAGEMTSTPISFPVINPNDQIKLKFCYNLQTENNPNYDIAEFFALGMDYMQRLAEADTWTTFSVDATAWAGQTPTFRWRFNTVDGVLNNYRGWQIDRIRIEVTSLECAAPITGDLNGDGSVGVPDLLILLAAWGPCPEGGPGTCPADLDGDGSVGAEDLLILLANWG